MKLIGELIEGISERAGLNNIREVGELLKTGRRSSDDAPTGAQLGDRAAALADVIGSDLLDFGQMLIAGMKSTTGDGAPDTGALFGHGRSCFNRAGQTLQSAGPNDSWDGSGSRAYADQNTRQQLRTEAMADADREVHRVLYREAFQINLRRGYLDDQSNFLAKTSYATFPLQFIPRYGEAAKLAIEVAALQAALSLSAHALYQLHSEVSANATDVRQALGRYDGVVDGAELPSADADFGPPPPPPGGSPTTTVPVEPPTVTVGVATGAPVAGGPGAATGATSPGALPQTAISGPPPVLDLPAAPSVPTPMAGEPTALDTARVAAAGPLGALISPLAGLLTGAALAVGRRASSAQRDQPDGGEESTDSEPEDEKDEKPEDASATATGGGTERAPIHGEIDSEPDRTQAPMTVRLGPDTAPGPPAGMSPQDTK